jgi:hypothetical protein
MRIFRNARLSIVLILGIFFAISIMPVSAMQDPIPDPLVESSHSDQQSYGSRGTSQLFSSQSPPIRRAPGLTAHSLQLSILHASGFLLNEDFEAGVVPPSGWNEVVYNHSYNWKTAVYGVPHSGDFAADVEYDDRPQDEWLLSPELALSQAALSFWSQGSVYWCRDTYDNCDLKVWIVVGDAGGADDIYIGQADAGWTADWTWSQATFDLSSLLPGGAVRIGFEYVGNDGAQILLDDILLDELSSNNYSFLPLIMKQPAN